MSPTSMALYGYTTYDAVHADPLSSSSTKKGCVPNPDVIRKRRGLGKRTLAAKEAQEAAEASGEAGSRSSKVIQGNEGRGDNTTEMESGPGWRAVVGPGIPGSGGQDMERLATDSGAESDGGQSTGSGSWTSRGESINHL
jgi:hypothetical protein